MGEAQSFLEFIGPTKALCYGLAVGFAIGIIYCMWVDHSDSTRRDRDA